MKLKESKMKFDLSEVDPDHVAWLKQEAESRSMTVDELLDAERLDKIAIDCGYREYQDVETLANLARLIEPIIPNIADARLRMAIKRQAAYDNESVGEYVADMFLSLLHADEEARADYIDPMTGLIKPGSPRY
jgi:hypothetical protein